MKRITALCLVVTLLLCVAVTAHCETTTAFYAPKSGRVGDVIPIYAEGRFMLFFLLAGEGKWAVTETTDFISYSDYKISLDFGGTGDIMYADGWYHLYAAKAINGKEIIQHYASRDLKNWNLLRDTLVSDGVNYVEWAWRDPRVFWNEEEQCYWMLVTSDYRDQNTVDRDGCVALLKSTDLKTWTYGKPLYAPGRYHGSFECSDYFKIGDWYYLVYSCACENKRTYYVKSQSPEGPWESPDVDTFDSFNFYAAKTVSDGTDRYIIGWSGEKTSSILPLGVNVSDIYSKDYANIGYAGNMIVHRIEQLPNGDLSVSMPQGIADAFTKEQKVYTKALSGEWNSENGCYTVEALYQLSALYFESPEDQYLLEFDVMSDAKEVGVAIHTNTAFMDEGYYYTLDRVYQRLSYKSGTRINTGAGYSMPFETEAERPLRIVPNETMHIAVLVEDDISVVYVNNQVALTTRNAYPEEPGIAFYCFGGTAAFSNVSLKTIK